MKPSRPRARSSGSWRRETEAAEISLAKKERIATEERAGIVLRVEDLERQAAEGRVALEAPTAGAGLALSKAKKLRVSLEDAERKGAVGEVAAVRVKQQAVSTTLQLTPQFLERGSHHLLLHPRRRDLPDRSLPLSVFYRHP